MMMVVVSAGVAVLAGPYGERDDQQVFIQKVIPITTKLFVRLSSTGKRYPVSLSLSLSVCLPVCLSLMSLHFALALDHCRVHSLT